MKHPGYRFGILLLRSGFVALGLLGCWVMLAIVEAPGLWWLFLLAAFGSFCAACILLAISLAAEDELDRIENPRGVPVPKIERRH